MAAVSQLNYFSSSQETGSVLDMETTQRVLILTHKITAT